ncbi:MAG: ribosome silencing factor [bacterium]
MPIKSAKKIALHCAEAALNKKANDVVILEMKKLTDMTDYFVICSGTSDVQIRAIADAIDELATKEKFKIHHIEGYEWGNWILIDLCDVIIHIFYEETRKFYDLEGLWTDAKVIEHNARS